MKSSSVTVPRCLRPNKKFIILIICLSLLFSGFKAEARVNELSSVALLDLINSYREIYNLESLTTNEELNKAALARINDMRKWHYFNHTNPVGLNFSFFAKDSGYEYDLVGENLARNYYTETELLAAWRRSYYHRKIILGENYQDIGVAFGEIEYKGKTNLISVMILGKEKPLNQ